MEKIKALLEQVDDSIAQENVKEDEALSFTPSDLRDMAERLNKTLESKPAPLQRKRKKSARKSDNKPGSSVSTPTSWKSMTGSWRLLASGTPIPRQTGTRHS